MSKKWYLYKNKEQKGPFTWEELEAQAGEGSITASDMIWSEGMEGWTKAGQVEDLLPKAPPAPPVAPPAPPAAPVTPPPTPPVAPIAPPQPPVAGAAHYSAPAPAGQNTSTGLEPNIAALLSYILGWLTGIIFFLIEKDNKYVRFHAMQSIIAFGGITILQIILGMLSTLLFTILWRGGVGSWGLASGLSSLIGILSLLIWVGTIALAVFLMIKAYNNEAYKLPIAGKYAEKQLY
jgi:uncharacterized membrane protein